MAQTQALLESPSANAFVRSGVGLIRGWACDATQIEISINDGPRLAAGYGTQRPDTESVCGDVNNGFGLTFNWNNIGDGVHHLRAFVDGVEFANVNFTVTTLGQDFITGLVKNYLLPNFPGAGQSTPVRWSEPHQNFVVAQSIAVPPPANPPPPAPRARLESPTQGSFESGVGLIRGWVCEAARIEISVDSGPRLPTAYGTPRDDTQAVCGDRNNGFGLTFNWNSLSDGVHHAQAFADGVEFASVNFAVTTLGADFLTGLDQKVALDDFPGDGQSTTLRWSEPDQNFTLAQTTATPPKLAIVSVITDLRNAFTVAGAGTDSTDATGVRAAKNAQGQPIQLQGVTWTDTNTRQAADIQLTTDGLPSVYTDSAGVEARFSAFTDATTTVSFHGPSGNVLAGPVTTPIDGSLILALQEMARRVFNGAQSAEGSVGGRQLAGVAPGASDRSTAATAEQVFTLNQLLANVYWYGSQAAGETVCAVERAAATVGVSGLIASTACQSPLLAALRSRLSARHGQVVVPDSGVDPIAQQSLRFDDDVVEAPCNPATDGAACLIQPAAQLQERQQDVPPPVPPEPEEPISTVTVTANAGAGGSISPTTQTVNVGATARFTVTPNEGYAIAAVSGCNGSLSGAIYTTGPITAACTVSASFTAAQTTYVLTLNVAGTGTGAVSGAGRYAAGDTVTLTATPNEGSVFASWNPAPCASSFIMPAQDLTCTATFRQSGYVVTATAGPGGTITPAAQTVEAGATARFTVTPDSGYAITSVTGCNGSLDGTIYVTGPITEACTVSASFTPMSSEFFTLSVNKAGNGEGVVTSSPAGINCGSQCSADYAANTVVTLIAQPLGNSSFAGWGEACSGGESQCVVTMNQAQSVTATFLQGQQGEVRFNLSWATIADLDLYVTDPCGNQIYYGNRSATCQDSTGTLDIDANVGDPVLNPAENVFWSSSPPRGQYQVEVCYYQSRDAGPTPYQVFIQLGNASQTVTGSIAYGNPCQLVGTFNF